MAVVPMQKVRAIVHRSDTETFLATLQRQAVMEFTEVEADNLQPVEVVSQHAALAPRVQHALTFLEAYETKKSVWRKLRDGSTHSYTEAEIHTYVDDLDAIKAVVQDVEATQVEHAEKTDLVRSLEADIALLKEWSVFHNNKLEDLETAHTTSFLVVAQEKGVDIHNVLEQLFPSGETTFEKTDLTSSAVLVTALRDGEEIFLEKMNTVSSVEVLERPRGKEAVSVELAAAEEQLAAARGSLGLLHDQAEHIARTHLQTLRIVSEILSWEQDRSTTQALGQATAMTAVFEGWIMKEAVADTEAALISAGVTAVISPLDTEEQPPVEIKNNGIFQPFEVVTRLYGMPGHKDLDPTLFLAGFFFLFFGLSLTDVGYGVFLMTTALIVLTLFKVAPGVRVFMKLLFTMGLGSALVGMLFGGYLGIAPEALPEWLVAIQVFDPIGNPLPVFYLALGLGVFQVMVGLLLKIYSHARNGQVLEGVLESGPWLFLFTVGILFVGVVTGYVSGITTDTLLKLSYLGVGLVVVAAARKGESILGRVLSVLAALYNDTIGYFSDILSYSRLLALGLATSALAFAVNLIAEIVGGTPVVGPVLAVVVLIIGHTFALAINTLGAFIHSARLQFVEFFSKFIDGSGRNFTPLARTRRYITARDE